MLLLTCGLGGGLIHKYRQLVSGSWVQFIEEKGMGQVFWCFFQNQDRIAHLSYTARLSHLFFAPKGMAVHFGLGF